MFMIPACGKLYSDADCLVGPPLERPGLARRTLANINPNNLIDGDVCDMLDYFYREAMTILRQ